MKRTTTSPAKPHPGVTEPADDSAEVLAARLAAFAAVWFALIFCYPARAFPIQSLVLHIVAAAVALLLAFYHLRPVRSVSISLKSMLPVFLVALFAAWTWIRWRTFSLPMPDGVEGSVRITSPGRHGVTTALWMLPLAVAGWAAGQTPAVSGAAFWRVFSRSLCIAGGAFAGYGLLQYFFLYDAHREELEGALSKSASFDPLMTQSLLHAFGEKRIGGRLGNGNVFAAQLAVFLVFAGAAMDRRTRLVESLFWRRVCALAFLPGTCAILLTQSRGGLLTLAFVAGCISLIALRSPHAGRKTAFRRAVAGILLVILVLAGAAAFLLRDRLTNLSTVRERFNYWRVASAVWARHPILGSGPGSYEILYPSLKPPTARESKFAHSWVFQAGSETGLVGLVLMAGLFGILSAPLIRGLLGKDADSEPETDANSENRLRQTQLSLACATLIFNGLFEYSLQMREFWLLLAFLGGGVGGLARMSAPTVPSVKAPLMNAVNKLLWLLVCVLGITAVWETTREHFAEFWRWQGQLQSQDDFHADAAASYHRAVNCTPDNAALVTAEGMELFYAGLASGKGPALSPAAFKPAADLFARAEELNPWSPSIRRAAAFFLQTFGDWQGAMKKRGEAVALYPNDTGYRLERAGTALHLGDEARARADVNFIVENHLPIWEFQRAQYDALLKSLGLSPPDTNPPAPANGT